LYFAAHMKTKSLILLIVILSACSKKNNDPAEEMLSVNKSDIVFTETKTSDTLTLEASSNWQLSVEPAVSWITVSPTEGANGSKIIVKAIEDNPTDSIRRATIHVKLVAGTKAIDVNVAQQPLVDVSKWHVYGGDSADHFYSGIKTSDNNIIAVGGSYSNTLDATGNHGGSDVWVVKIDSSGKMLWHRMFGGSAYETATDIVKAGDDSYIICGYAGSADGDVTRWHGGMDGWLLKIDGDGNLIWQKNIGGYKHDVIYYIKNTLDGNFILSGQTNGHGDQWLAKIDGDGNIIWQKTFGGSGEDLGMEVSCTSDGGYAFTGFGTTADGDLSDKPTNSNDAWVVKTDAQGEIEWKTYIAGAGEEKGFNVIELSNGNLLTAGTTSSSDVFPRLYGFANMYLTLLSPAGDILSNKIIGQTQWEESWEVSEAENGNIFIVGHVGPGQDRELFDAAFFEVTPFGELVSKQTFGKSGMDYAAKLIHFEGNRYAFVGMTGRHYGGPTLNGKGWYYPFQIN
jgi:hypothetical protein